MQAKPNRQKKLQDTDQKKLKGRKQAFSQGMKLSCSSLNQPTIPSLNVWFITHKTEGRQRGKMERESRSCAGRDHTMDISSVSAVV